MTLIDQPTVEDYVSSSLPDAVFLGTNLESIELVLDRQFDLIICADVVEHCINPDPMMRFMRNHLSPDGRLVISTPERDYRHGYDNNRPLNKVHVREWNRVEFRQYVESQGFTCLRHVLLPTAPIRGRKEWLVKMMIPHAIWKYSQVARKRWGACQMIECQNATTERD